MLLGLNKVYFSYWWLFVKNLCFYLIYLINPTFYIITRMLKENLPKPSFIKYTCVSVWYVRITCVYVYTYVYVYPLSLPFFLISFTSGYDGKPLRSTSHKSLRDVIRTLKRHSDFNMGLFLLVDIIYVYISV